MLSLVLVVHVVLVITALDIGGTSTVTGRSGTCSDNIGMGFHTDDTNYGTDSTDSTGFEIISTGR